VNAINRAIFSSCSTFNIYLFNVSVFKAIYSTLRVPFSVYILNSFRLSIRKSFSELNLSM